MIQKAINKDIDIREEFDKNEHDKKDIDWDTLKHIHINLKTYKEKKYHFRFQ